MYFIGITARKQTYFHTYIYAIGFDLFDQDVYIYKRHSQLFLQNIFVMYFYKKVEFT